jgi:hypothetical protein
MTVRVAALASLLLALATPVAAQTIEDIQTKAATGDRQSQFLLGEAFRTGQGVTPDRDQAIVWFRKAAAQGDTRASDAMGLLLFTKGDRKEAIPLLEAAEARQDPRASYLLGTARFNGDGVPKDLPRAYAEMRAAADKGLPQAIRSLQLMEPYISDKDRLTANTIRPGQSTVMTTATLPTASALPTPMAPAATVPVPPPAVTPAVARPAPAPIRTTAVPPSVTPTAAPTETPAVLAPLASAGFGSAAPSSMPAPLSAPVPKPVLPRAVAPLPKPATASGNWRVQLGAIATQEKAEEHWQTLAKKLPQLASLPHVVVQAGAIWRLQVTGLASRAEAQELCAAVVAKGGVCIALNPAS